MKSPRIFVLTALLALLLVGKSHAQYTDLLSLSDPAAFGPLVGGGGIFFSGTGSQGATGVVVNGAINNGDFIYAPFSSLQNWSALFTPGSYFSIFMNTASPNPNVAMSLEFLDGDSATIDVWSGFSGAAAVNGYVDFDTLGTSGTGDYSIVSAIQITWANPEAATINTTMSTIAVVPEPSTYALLALSGLAFGGYIIRRRRRA
jgi:hypothetical protein